MARGSEVVKPRPEGFPGVCSWRQRDEGPGLPWGSSWKTQVTPGEGFAEIRLEREGGFD